MKRIVALLMAAMLMLTAFASVAETVAPEATVEPTVTTEESTDNYVIIVPDTTDTEEETVQSKGFSKYVQKVVNYVSDKTGTVIDKIEDGVKTAYDAVTDGDNWKELGNAIVDGAKKLVDGDTWRGIGKDINDFGKEAAKKVYNGFTDTIKSVGSWFVSIF